MSTKTILAGQNTTASPTPHLEKNSC